jgi:hypothetical protein
MAVMTTSNNITPVTAATFAVGLDSTRERICCMPAAELSHTVHFENIDLRYLTERVEAKAAALDGYIASISREELAPPGIRKRMLLAAVMGGVPLAGAVAVAALLYFGFVTSSNGKILAAFSMIACALIAMLALLSAIHIVLQSAFHNWLVARSATDQCNAFVFGTEQLAMKSYDLAYQVVLHYRSYPQLRTLLGHITLKKP